MKSATDRRKSSVHSKIDLCDIVCHAGSAGRFILSRRLILAAIIIVLPICTAGCNPPTQTELANFFVDFARQMTAAWLF
ncbi:MAG: hypothetical protein HY287_12635 [Planctomycetes bacterium]|nr:hypothetical protein [Planctomycetota bacterium]MBI3835169.1 hypothetical protein [Planctomycetota bacterium]